jgi:Zn-dependent M16 (insulinase) family peptidase
MIGWRSPGMLAACIIATLSAQAKGDFNIMNLEKGQHVASFEVENLYLNEADKAIGARFRHTGSGFVLDLLRIQSVPQAFMWVNSFPPSDQGEPHTCEHLMLGKGTKGRYVGSLEEMRLGNSSAFTAQLQTCYHFHTAAGADAFYELMEAKLDALIHPNFTDEEIRREVCNMGYTVDPVDSTIGLEEKGTVYNEMISGYERPWGNLGRKLGHVLYGVNHPLSNESGGYPDAIRNMVPKDMRKFIEDNYHLSNMGMIISIGDEIDLEDCLDRISGILSRIEPNAKPGIDPATADQMLPEPKSDPYGTTAMVGFPSQNEKEPGLLIFAWPPIFDYDNSEGFLLELFMSNLASGETSNLFRKFIDSQTRIMNLGANAVFEWVSSDQGHPIHVVFNNVRQEVCNEAVIDTVRKEILAELERIIELPDNSPELLAFNERAKNRVIERRRDLNNFLNTPPGFGYRGTSGRWLDHLKHLQRQEGFAKKLTLDNELENAETLLSTGRNFWKDYARKWRLLELEPFAVASCPDPNLLLQTERARAERIKTFIGNLKSRFNITSDGEAIKQFRNEYDSKTELIDRAAREIAMPGFVENPPLTLDDQLRYTVEELPGGRLPGNRGQMVSSTFEYMTSSMIGLAFRMDVVPESLLLYVAALPSLLTEVGATKDRLYAYDEMKEAVRREIMELRAYYSTNLQTQRVELVARAEGGNIAESKEALEWLEAILFRPNWTPENLPRMRDAIDLALSDLRNTMRGPEEAWVDDPANAYWRQNNPLMLSTSCFLTQAHAFQRLRWLLKDPGPQSSSEPFSQFMKTLSSFGEQASRKELFDLLGVLSARSSGQADSVKIENRTTEVTSVMDQFRTLPGEARTLVLDAVEDLKQDLAEVPDVSLANDWRYLCAQIDADLQVPPQKVLADLRYLMNLILRMDNVRVFTVSSSESKRSLEPQIKEIISQFPDRPSEHQAYGATPIIMTRLKERVPGSHGSEEPRPIFVGLVNDNTRSGVFINSAPCASFEDSDPDILLKFLAARLYGGGGAHSMFMKTWSAGLAYSNGLRSNEFTGRLLYYAERCPDLAQTMQFVVNELNNAPRDSSLADYAVAQAFSVYRTGSRYEARGEAMAADLADGLTPEKVSRFRKGILGLRNTPNLYDRLYVMMKDTYGMVLPGYGPTADKVKDAIYFIVGPESQFRSYEEYLHSVEGDFILHRLYPRDFWIVKPVSESKQPQ